MQEGVESTGEFVVSGCDTAELLKAIEESLDKVSCLVAVPVDFALGVAIVSRWDDCFGPGGLDDVDQGVAVVTFIGNDSAGRDCLNQGSSLRHIGHLASRQDQANRVAQGINTSMNLGGQPAPRTTDRLIATVFLGAPAACWWARTIVASMNSSSKSASPWRASATRCQTPYSSQRANRTYTECQLPSSLGKSRQGDPVRARYRTASTKHRLSVSVVPRPS